MLLLLVGAANPAAVENAGEILGVNAPFVHRLNPQPAGAARVSWFFPAGHNMRLTPERVDNIAHLNGLVGLFVNKCRHGLGSKGFTGYGQITGLGKLGPGLIVPGFRQVTFN